MRLERGHILRGRRSMDKARDSYFELGDVLLEVKGFEDGSLERLLDELDLPMGRARDYMHTARMCTAPVREWLSTCGVFVCYSILRDGGRVRAGGQIPHDENYNLLRRMVEKAQAAGKQKVTHLAYRQALGTAPSMHQVIHPTPATQDASDQVLAALRYSPDRTEVATSLVQEHTQDKRALALANEELAREREQTRITYGTRASGKATEPDQGERMLEDLAQVTGRIRECMDRYQGPILLTPAQLTAYNQQIGTFVLFEAWSEFVLGGVPDPSDELHDLAGV